MEKDNGVAKRRSLRVRKKVIEIENTQGATATDKGKEAKDRDPYVGNNRSPTMEASHDKICFESDEDEAGELLQPNKLFIKCSTCGIYTANMEKHQEIHSKPYKCPDCKLDFDSKVDCNNHCKKEHSKVSIKCYYCWETFERMELLAEHTKSRHQKLNNKFSCTFCGKPCQDNHCLATHLLVHTKEKPHKCGECDKSYVLESSLSVHMKVHNKEMYKCDICSKEFSRKGKLRAHKATHDDEDRKNNWILCPHIKPTYETSNNNFPVFCEICDGAAVCTFCGFGFENKRLYMAHTHNNFCTKCGVKFFDGRHYRKHKLYHLNEIKLKCEVCQYGFETEVAYGLHNAKQHSIHRSNAVTGTANKKKLTTKKYQCSVCAKEFTTNQNLGFHLKSSHYYDESKMFVCLACGAEFVNKTLLNIHKRKHDKTKNFYCGICDKQFTRKTDLNRHEETHSGNKPFACEICGVRVKSNRNLKLHMDTHAKKSYECNECKKLFRQKCYLKVHMKIHQNKKTHQCEKCDKSFLKQQGLDEHVLVHSGVSNYHCENCDKYFCSQFSLRKHVALKFCIDENNTNSTSIITID